MGKRFVEKTAVVTGGAGGIGYATAVALADEGAFVVVVDIDGEGARTAAQLITDRGGEAKSFECDSTDKEKVQAVVAEIVAVRGQIDVLVNSAGVSTGWERAETNAGLEFSVDVNLLGSFYWARAVAVASMIPRRQGSIVNLASIAGLAAIPLNVGYSASKFAVVGMTAALALDWAEYGIRVNATAPGITPGRMLGDWAETDPDSFNARLARVPMNRLGKPEEQANVILFLASDAASFVTGVTIPVDGGQMALNPGHTVVRSS